MAFNLNRKLYMYIQNFGPMLQQQIRVLEAAAKLPQIASDSTLPVKEYQKAQQTLAAYVAQLSRKPLPGAAPVRPEEAARAWDDLQSIGAGLLPRIGAMLPNIKSDVNAYRTMSNLNAILRKTNDFFTRLNALESRIPDSGIVDAPVDAHSAENALPLLDAFAAFHPVSKLMEVYNSAAVRDNASLDFARFLTAVQILDNGTARHSDDPEARRQMADAWAYMRANAKSIRENAAAAAARLPLGSPDRAAMMKLQGVAAGYCDIIARTDAREQVRENIMQDRAIRADAAIAARELEMLMERARVEEDDIYEDSVHEPTVSENRRATLAGFKARMELMETSYEIELPRLNRQVHDLSAQLQEKHADVLPYLHSARTIDELDSLENNLRTQRMVYNDRIRELERDTENWSAQILRDAGIKGHLALPEMMRECLKNSHDHPEDSARDMESLLESSGLPDGVRASLRSAYQQNKARYDACFQEIDLRDRCLDAMPTYIDLRMAELQRATVVNLARPFYQAELRKVQAAEPGKVDADYRQQLRGMAEQLQQMRKFGSDTEEYRDFRAALDSAAGNGSFDALRAAARHYVDEKTRGGKAPSTANGIGRLSMAQSVLELLDTRDALAAEELPPLEVPQVNEEVIKPGYPENFKVHERVPLQELAEEIHVHLSEPEPEEEEILPLQLPAEKEPLLPHKPAVSYQDNHMLKDLVDWVPRRLQGHGVPEREAEIIGRQLINMLFSHMTGEEDAPQRLEDEFQSKFYVGDKRRPPLTDVPLKLITGSLLSVCTDFTKEYQDAQPENEYERVMVRLQKLPLPATEGQKEFMKQATEYAEEHMHDRYPPFLSGMNDRVFTKFYSSFRPGDSINGLIEKAQQQSRANHGFYDPQVLYGNEVEENSRDSVNSMDLEY